MPAGDFDFSYFEAADVGKTHGVFIGSYFTAQRKSEGVYGVLCSKKVKRNKAKPEIGWDENQSFAYFRLFKLEVITSYRLRFV
ncbi:hypothetical protein [uncultured Enterococcus sp.]|uniref:hypothetical protein n=1 Tax=uncultured Enterococcus sp. TaxID=167972 RepID=UPI002AA93D81|nr:hypothetical protein [uncultured Enterococcus sp.]